MQCVVFRVMIYMMLCYVVSRSSYIFFSEVVRASTSSCPPSEALRCIILYDMKLYYMKCDVLYYIIWDQIVLFGNDAVRASAPRAHHGTHTDIFCVILSYLILFCDDAVRAPASSRRITLTNRRKLSVPSR